MGGKTSSGHASKKGPLRWRAQSMRDAVWCHWEKAFGAKVTITLAAGWVRATAYCVAISFW
jgi:hypothetical protein